MFKQVNLKYVIIYIVLLLAVTIVPSAWKIHQQHKVIVDLRAKNVAQWEKWKNDSTKIVVQAEEIKELNNLYASQVRTTAKWKSIALKVPVFDTSAIPNPIDTLTDCYYIELRKDGLLNIIPQPVLLNIDIAYVDKHLSIGRVWSEPECIIFEDTRLNIPTNLNLDCYKENKWPWVIGALGAGFIAGCLVE